MFNPRSLLALLIAMFTLGAVAADAPKGINLWQPGDPGQPLHIQGQVRSFTGEPVAGASLTVWQADGNGEYHDDRYRATLTTDQDGSYGFGTVLPGQYYNAKHIHIAVDHADYEPLETRILFKGDPHLDEATERERAIFLEQARSGDQTFLFGRFDILLRPTGGH